MKALIPAIQIGFITALSLIGQWLSTTFHLPLPGNLLGMFILFALLCFGIVKEEQIAEGSDLLLKYMAFFFIPAGVGLLGYLDLLSPVWLQWATILALSTVLVMAITAKTVDLLMKKESRRL